VFLRRKEINKMEFIHKKTHDKAAEPFLLKAAERGISLVWDRYEAQLPECGFCESGLSCRDCLQGPCISHPFRGDQSKVGVCGKNKDILGAHSLLRLVIKGTMAYLDQVTDFAKDLKAEDVSPADKAQTDKVLGHIQGLFDTLSPEVMKAFPEPLTRRWEEAGVYPEGIARDLLKASQKLEGGVTGVNETLLWAFKCSLLTCAAQMLQGALKNSAFGNTAPTELEVNLGILEKEVPTVLLYGHLSPVLKRKVAEAGEKKGVSIMGVCTDPLLPPYTFAPVTTYGSQEIPLLTGAVDLIVTGDQYVNPSLQEVAREWKVTIVPAEVLINDQGRAGFAEKIIDQAKKAFETRPRIAKDIPDVKEAARMGFSVDTVDMKKIVDAINGDKIKGIAILAGSNNVKFTQDYEIVSMAQEFLKNDVLCISEGEASVSLAKYGFLNPQSEMGCGEGLSGLLSSLGEHIPSILDVGSSENSGVAEFLLGLSRVEKKEPKEYPIVAVFPEANRSMDVTNAMWTVAMGVSTFFWPFLPVTGSPKMMEALTDFCKETFGAKLHVITRKLDERTKSTMVVKSLTGEEDLHLEDHPWG
jgi:carbon-monoxide dehydrogenase catalytic subunit